MVKTMYIVSIKGMTLGVKKDQAVCDVILRNFSKTPISTLITPESIMRATADPDIKILFQTSSAKSTFHEFLSRENIARFEIADKEKRIEIEK